MSFNYITRQSKIAHKNTWAGLANARLLLRRYVSATQKKLNYQLKINKKETMNKPKQTTFLLILLLISVSIKANTANFDIEIKTLLRLTDAKSVQELASARTQKMHEIMQYFESFKNCEKSFTKLNYLNNNKLEFVKNPQLAKTTWNEFIDNDFRNIINEKLSTLTKDNLKNRYKECSLREDNIQAKINEFEINNMKTNPDLRLDLDFKRDQKFN